MGKTNVIKNPEKHELVFERVFNASQDVVWKAWTVPEEIEKWWGPRGWETTVKQHELKQGGVWYYCMKCVDKNQGDYYGVESCGIGTFKEINEPDEFTYLDQFADSDGKVNESMPSSLSTLQFIDLGGGKTKLVSRSTFDSLEDYNKVIEMGVELGYTETLDRFEELVEGK